MKRPASQHDNQSVPEGASAASCDMRTKELSDPPDCPVSLHSSQPDRLPVPIAGPSSTRGSINSFPYVRICKRETDAAVSIPQILLVLRTYHISSKCCVANWIITLVIEREASKLHCWPHNGMETLAIVTMAAIMIVGTVFEFRCSLGT